MKKHLQNLKNIFLTLVLLLTISASAFAQSSGTFTMTDGQNYTPNITLTGNVTYHVPTGIAIISGNISGAFKVTKTGNGNLRFSGSNTYSGGTTIDGGTLVLGNGGATGSIYGDVVVNSGAWFGYQRSNGYTFSNVISGAGGVTKWDCAGSLTLDGVNTYAGRTDIYGGGYFALGANGTIANSTSVWLMDANSKFNLTSWKRIKNLNSTQANAEINITTAGTLCVGNVMGTDGGGTYAGKITGAGKFHKDGSATLTLSGNSAYTGETGIYWGTVVFSANSLGTGNIYFRGTQAATLRWATGNTADISGRIKTDLPTAPIVFDVGSNNVTFATALPTVTGTVTKTGSGLLILCGTQTYTGATVVVTGSLQIGSAIGTNNGNLNSTSGVEVKTGAQLIFSGSGTTTFSKKITGAGKVYCAGTDNKKNILTANNDYTGGTEIKANTILHLGNSSPDGSVVGNITNNGELIFNNTTQKTYSGVISGSGKVTKWNAESKLIFTGDNTYSGETTLWGTLQVGNGTSASSIKNTSTVVLKEANTILRFEPGADLTFAKQITGTGKVEYKGGGVLYFTANNTYTGTTTIESGNLYLGSNTTAGSIAGNIINNGQLTFFRSNAYTYSGIISGTGNVIFNKPVTGLGETVTLNGNNTYTGKTDIYAPLVLGATGSIENSSSVTLRKGSITGNAKLNISAGDKKIKELNGNYSDAEVILGARILTLNGGGDFQGKFSGTGGVTKTGTALFAMSGNNTATGLFSLDAGTVELTTWGGNFTQNAGTGLDVKGITTVNGILTLKGGEITMDLLAATPSKINVMGAVYASGNTKLTIATGAVTNRSLMQAASGISDASLYTLNMPGFTANLTATGTELLLTATTTDNTPPTPGAGVNGTEDYGLANLSWGAATDDQTPQENLRYFVYQSTSNNINTVANCEANGTLLNPGGTVNITEYTALSLEPITYYFNVLVADLAGNKATYTTKQLNIPNGINEPAAANITVYPNPTTGELKMENGELRIENVEIFDVYGKKISSFTSHSSPLISIDISHLSNGVYFLRIQTEQGMVTKKVIKN